MAGSTDTIIVITMIIVHVFIVLFFVCRLDPSYKDYS